MQPREPPYLINQACIKKYSACTFAHTSIDALGLIMKENKLRYQDIEYVETASANWVTWRWAHTPSPSICRGPVQRGVLVGRGDVEGRDIGQYLHGSAVLTDPARHCRQGESSRQKSILTSCIHRPPPRSRSSFERQAVRQASGQLARQSRVSAEHRTDPCSVPAVSRTHAPKAAPVIVVSRNWCSASTSSLTSWSSWTS